MKWAVIVAAVVVVIGVAAAVFLIVSGGETNEQVFARYEPKFNALRGKLKSIANKLPPKGSVVADKRAADLNPKPIYNVKSDTFNTAIVMYEQLLDPDVKIQTPENFNIRLGYSDFITHLCWTGPDSPMAASALRNTARSELPEELERSLNMRYLVVIRTTRYARPVVHGRSFTGGTVQLEGFVVLLDTEQIIASFQTSAKPDERVRSTFRKGVDNPEDRGEAFVYSSMWTNARENVARKLAEVTGGTFVFER